MLPLVGVTPYTPASPHPLASPPPPLLEDLTLLEFTVLSSQLKPSEAATALFNLLLGLPLDRPKGPPLVSVVGRLLVQP